MTNLWQSFVAHWAIPLVSWVFGTFVGATFRWFYPSRREWLEGRKTKREAKADAMVLGAIRALCESNSGIYNTQDIAERLGTPLDDTADSLERLENIGRVQSYNIGTTDSPGPGWRSKFR